MSTIARALVCPSFLERAGDNTDLRVSWQENFLNPSTIHGIISEKSIISNFFQDLAAGREPPMTNQSEADNMERAKRATRSTLIEPFNQIKFGIYVISASVAFVIMIGLMFIYTFYQQYQHLMGIFNITDAKDQLELVTNDIFYRNAIKILILLVGYILGMFVLVFKLTHRYYGPLVSIERFVDEITLGKYKQRVKIRQKDELQRLTSRLNTMADALEKRHGGDVSKAP
jgi:HAMP domain-containing protein